MEKNRKEFHDKITGQKINPTDPNGRLIMNDNGVQFSYDAWVKTFFNNLDGAKSTLANFQKVAARTDDTNWIKRLLPNHIPFLKDEATFIKSYACDLSWATALPYCKQDNNQPADLKDYEGFYTGLDDEGKTQRQEIVVDGGKLVSSVRKKPAGKINIILTPTSTKDVFNVELKNMMIKTSSGTATFKRNKDGKVCSVVSSVKATAINNEEVSMDATASKEGVSCDGPTPVPDNNNNQNQNNNNQQPAPVSGAFPDCAGRWGAPTTAFVIFDKTSNEVATFFCEPKDQAKAQADADKYIKDNATKQLELRKQMGRFVSINSDFNNPFSYPQDKLLIIFKDKTFVSNSNDVHYGTWDCGEKQGNIKITNTINEEYNARKILLNKFKKFIK